MGVACWCLCVVCADRIHFHLVPGFDIHALYILLACFFHDSF